MSYLALEFDSDAFTELIIGVINAILDQAMNLIIALFWTQLFLGIFIPFVTGSDDLLGIDNVLMILIIGICFAFWFFLRKFP